MSPTGIEPAHTASEADALSTELRERTQAILTYPLPIIK